MSFNTASAQPNLLALDHPISYSGDVAGMQSSLCQIDHVDLKLTPTSDQKTISLTWLETGQRIGRRLGQYCEVNLDGTLTLNQTGQWSVQLNTDPSTTLTVSVTTDTLKIDGPLRIYALRDQFSATLILKGINTLNYSRTLGDMPGGAQVTGNLALNPSKSIKIFDRSFPSETFTGYVNGDYNAQCRINFVAVEFPAGNDGTTTLRWLETGNRQPPYDGACENKLMAELSPQGYATDGTANSWELQFDFFPNDLMSNATLDANVFRVNANILDSDGNSVAIQADMLFKPDHKTMTYVRTVRPTTGPSQDVTGVLTAH